ncbi:MAG: ATP-binding protein [Rhodothermales bacterium]
MCWPVFAQDAPYHEQVGYAYDLHRFPAEAYAGHGQNWGVVQDRRGIAYVANHSGILEYDSARWRRIRMANGEGAFSVALSDSGVVFVGGRGEIGYLAADSLGAMQFVSLLGYVPADRRNFTYVWNTVRTSHGVFFQTNKRILRWDGQAMKVWDSDLRMHTAFGVEDRFFVRTDSIGLQEISGDELHAVAGGDLFARKRIVSMTPAGASSILIAAQKGIDGPLELYLMVEGDISPIEVDDHLKGSEIAYYNGVALPSGYLALSTMGSGVVIIRRDGQLIQVLDENYGVPRDGNGMHVDANGGLWIAHNANGVSRVNAPVALTEFGPSHGLPEVHDMIRFGDRFYTASANGIFRLKQRDPSDGGLYNPRAFEAVAEKPLTAWAFAAFRGELFAGTEEGVMRLAGDRFKLLPLEEPIKNVRRIVASERYPDRVYLGMQKGLGRLEKKGSTWDVVRFADEISDPVLSMSEEGDGTLWVVTRSSENALWKIRFAGPSDRTGVITRIDPEAMPWDGHVVLAAVDGTMRFVPRRGLFMHETDGAGADRFVADTLLASPHIVNDSLVTLSEIGDVVWLVYRDHLVYAQKTEEGGYVRHTLEEVNMPRWGASVSVYEDHYGTMWIACGSNLYRYVERLDTGVDRTVYFNPLIRRVTIAATDSLLLANPGEAWTQFGTRLELDHETNDLTFDFVLPEYTTPDEVLYKYKLEHFDSRWSDWSPATSATYRNLGAGVYEFKVQAQTRSHLFTNEVSASFRIHRPWYWNGLAWTLYGLILLTPVVQFVRHRRAREELKELERERSVNQRLNEANSQLRTANETLKQANKLKDEFLANASHELRTPLTAILGFTDVLKEEIPAGQIEFLELIDENGKRLLKTINSLLDLTKLRAGMLEVRLEVLDICEKSEEVVDMMSQLARNKHLHMHVRRPDAPIETLLDTHCFERIMYNLIGNAIKFTDEGEIAVEVEQEGNEVRIHVSDTGVGIAESFIPHLFSEFKQEPRDDGQPEGSGLGLAITSHLVDLMGGRILVKSVKGSGSTFTIVFPIHREAGDGHAASSASGDWTESASTPYPSS